MIGDVHQLMWGLAGAVVLAVLITIGLRVVGRRQRREHDALIRDAAARMCAQLDGGQTTLRRLQRDLVEIVERQDEGVRRLEGAVGEPAADRLSTSPEDEAVLAAAVAMTPRIRADREGGWPTRGRAPRVADHPDLPRLCAWMRSTTLHQIRLARAVLAHAARLEEPDETCRRCLLTAFSHAANKARASGQLAASGRTLAALRELTRMDLPIPEDHVPGQATVHDLRQQVGALAVLALGHRQATALWLATARPQVTTKDEGEA